MLKQMICYWKPNQSSWTYAKSAPFFINLSTRNKECIDFSYTGCSLIPGLISFWLIGKKWESEIMEKLLWKLESSIFNLDPKLTRSLFAKFQYLYCYVNTMKCSMIKMGENISELDSNLSDWSRRKLANM